ncbi:hypothetical protein [Phascolarctobacterium succinatutens]
MPFKLVQQIKKSIFVYKSKDKTVYDSQRFFIFHFPQYTDYPTQ